MFRIFFVHRYGDHLDLHFLTRLFPTLLSSDLPIAQSKSPLIHRVWLGALGIAGDYRRAHVKPDELAAYIAERRADPDWRGCNVTMPHKGDRKSPRLNSSH